MDDTQNPNPDFSAPVSDATVEADRRDAQAEHRADSTEADSADAADLPDGTVPASVAEAERESTKRGANLKGEGQIMGTPADGSEPEESATPKDRS